MLGVAAIAILSEGLVHARAPREMSGVLTGALLLLALAGSVVLKTLTALRARRQMARINIQQTNPA